MPSNTVYFPKNKIRIVTASSLFDGHDASINIMRRMLQASGAEVIHLGHNRSAEEVVSVAIQEDVQGIAVSSYQGGHMEYFKYMYDLLQERDCGHILIFGGGGGVIVPREIKELEEYGIARVYSPDDGRELGLQGMINDIIERCDFPTVTGIQDTRFDTLQVGHNKTIAQCITYMENKSDDMATLPLGKSGQGVVVGVTGTGGAGKSSLTDEIIRRFLYDQKEKSIAILSIDPTKQRTGGALLGDRIRMNSIHNPRVYMRSLGTRGSKTELSAAIQDAIAVVKHAGFDLIIVETSGIGQGDAEIVNISDVSMYVMTSEFGAPSQLEKIDMLDYADLIVINKFDRKGSADALREVRKQYKRNHNCFHVADEHLPIYGTIASQFHDPGTNVLYRALIDTINRKMKRHWECHVEANTEPVQKRGILAPERVHYLAQIVDTARQHRKFAEKQSELARKLFQLQGSFAYLQTFESMDGDRANIQEVMEQAIGSVKEQLNSDVIGIIEGWEQKSFRYQQDQLVTKVRDKEIRTDLYTVSLSGTRIPKVCLPKYKDFGEIVRWSLLENVPGEFPYTAGVFPLKRAEEDPKRQFAGEGTPERTNRRFHFLSQNDSAKRLSTAFDSVTLYGENPSKRPDIYGKVGESGVSICTLDDMKKLYAGFDLCHPSTSVSMTINGPAPILLAMFMNTAIDQQVERFSENEGRYPTEEEQKRIQARTLQMVRGTVQADILKEDQGQNTCIFSTDFALRMMGDIQEYFVEHNVRNYYSVSISGYHIAEAGANPISQLAFTLANAFTYVEYYLSRGMQIDDFAPNLSFFFSNGMDPEYTVLGRVARRIWAIVIKHRYGGNERSQKLKYHIQTSGRSLHAQEIQFNDIRTTLQALLAIYDNCNSLHTNAYDEAITTPTEESVRRAMAIQMIITKEFGLAKNENALQGSFIVEELTDLVEAAVLEEFMRLNDRGGVLGAMETQYQRGKIQDESMYYELQKHSGELPIIGVNMFINPEESFQQQKEIQLARATKEEKEQQIRSLAEFHNRYREQAPMALARLQETAKQGGNVFAALMETVQYASLGQITHALYEVGGQYRRNM
ncbi:methylmalonyl-CoA mutase family protein [Fodinisporobacter ferrooxydans]|uniref:Fused isobutyryl-CoA mutase n=1 Tax=Fodinisporobacter ferrooxydans TaxID=2901836 RepID=A0ABY4CKH3_9BACL|nr:methylmalonyl-CoA mutase family protein [Alicyclobacillaceae bacterium MYW30-H2]